MPINLHSLIPPAKLSDRNNTVQPSPKTKTAGSVRCQPFHFRLENLSQLPVSTAAMASTTAMETAATVESASTMGTAH